MLKMIAKLLKALNSETEPAQISLAACLGMIVGFTPLWSLHNLFLLLVAFILRVNLSAFLLAWGVFSGMAYLLDPLFHALGLSILTADSLKMVWTALYNNIWFRLDGFNNTITMGSLMVSLALFIPLLLLMNLSIRKYREHLLAWVKKSRLAQAVLASRLYKTYQTVSGWGGRS